MPRGDGTESDAEGGESNGDDDRDTWTTRSMVVTGVDINRLLDAFGVEPADRFPPKDDDHNADVAHADPDVDGDESANAATQDPAPTANHSSIPLGPVGMRRLCTQRQRRRCYITRTRHGACQCSHIVPRSAAFDLPRTSFFWLMVLIVLGPKMRDWLWSEVGGKRCFSPTNGCLMNPMLHGAYDSGKFMLEPRHPPLGTVPPSGYYVTHYDVRMIFTKAARDLDTTTTRLPRNADEQLSLHDGQYKAVDTTTLPHRSLENGDCFRLYTQNPESHPLPHPRLLEVHNVLWVLIECSGMSETRAHTKRMRRTRAGDNTDSDDNDTDSVDGEPGSSRTGAGPGEELPKKRGRGTRGQGGGSSSRHKGGNQREEFPARQTNEENKNHPCAAAATLTRGTKRSASSSFSSVELETRPRRRRCCHPLTPNGEILPFSRPDGDDGVEIAQDSKVGPEQEDYTSRTLQEYEGESPATLETLPPPSPQPSSTPPSAPPVDPTTCADKSDEGDKRFMVSFAPPPCDVRELPLPWWMPRSIDIRARWYARWYPAEGRIMKYDHVPDDDARRRLARKRLQPEAEKELWCWLKRVPQAAKGASADNT